MIKKYVIEFWNDESWEDAATFEKKDDAEKELSDLLKIHNPADLRVVGYFL